MVKGFNGPRFLWPGEVNQGGVVGRWRWVWMVHRFKMVRREVKLTTGAVERV